MEDQVKITLEQILEFAESNPDSYVKIVKKCIKDKDGHKTAKIGIIISINDDLDE